MIAQEQIDYFAPDFLAQIGQGISGSARESYVDYFIEGRRAFSNKEFSLAIAKFKSSLEKNSRFNASRVYLGFANLRLGKDDATAYHFKLALSGDMPDYVREQINAFLRNYQSRIGWNQFFTGGLSYQTNPKFTFELDEIRLGDFTLAIDEDSRAKPQEVVDIRTGVNYIALLDESLKFQVGGSVSFEHYLDDNDLYWDPEVFINVINTTRNAFSYSFGMFYLQRHFEGIHLSENSGVHFSPAYKFSDRTKLSNRLQYRYINNSLNDEKDGHEYRLISSFEYFLSSNMLFNFRLDMSKYDIPIDSLSYQNTQISASIIRQFKNQIRGQISLSAGNTSFDDVSGIFRIKRNDYIYNLNTRLTFDKINVLGFSPFVEANYKKRQSNIDTFDNTNFSMQAGISSTY